MRVETASAFRLEPTLDFGTLVRAVVVHDQVDFLISGKLSLQVIEEADELPAPVAILTVPDYLSR